jgi:pimeloyl-ACP methyl ester carboxylesterase
MRWRGSVVSVLALAVASGCRTGSDVAMAEQKPAQAAAVEDSAPRERPIEVVTQPVTGDLPVFLLRGQPGEKGTVVFMHGMCGHGLGYVQSFQFAAASRANVIGLQGDVPCSDDGTWRKWSRDLDALDDRIRRALDASGVSEDADEVVLVGYSQGGTRALELAAKWPERFARIAAIGAPHEATVRELRRARKVAVMAGEHDAPRWRRSQALALERAGVPAAFFELPGASHGEMGPEGERVMGEVLDWMLHDPPR